MSCHEPTKVKDNVEYTICIVIHTKPLKKRHFLSIKKNHS